MTDHRKLQFFDLLAQGKLIVQHYNQEDVWEEQQWEIQEIGEIPWGGGDIGVCANWWGETLIEAIKKWAKSNN